MSARDRDPMDWKENASEVGIFGLSILGLSLGNLY